MTRKLDSFLKEEKQKRERVDNLSKSISDDKAALSKTRTEYEAAVIADDDEATSILFKEIERLENKIKADEHKLVTLQTVTDRHLRQSAIETLQAFPDEVRTKHQALADVATGKIQEARTKYIESLHVLDGLNESYNAERNEYKPLLRRYKLERRDIDNSNSLYSNIENIGKIAPNKTNMIVTFEHIQKGLENL